MKNLLKIFMLPALFMTVMFMAGCKTETEEPENQPVYIDLYIYWQDNSSGNLICNCFPYKNQEGPVITEDTIVKLNAYLDSFGLTKADGIKGFYTDSSFTNLLTHGELTPVYESNNLPKYIIYTKVNEKLSDLNTICVVADKNKTYPFGNYITNIFPKKSGLNDIKKVLTNPKTSIFKVYTCSRDIDPLNEFQIGSEWKEGDEIQGKIIMIVLNQSWEEAGTYFINVLYKNSITQIPFSSCYNYPPNDKSDKTKDVLLNYYAPGSNFSEFKVMLYDKEKSKWGTPLSESDKIKSSSTVLIQKGSLYYNLGICGAEDQEGYRNYTAIKRNLSLDSNIITEKDLDFFRQSVKEYGLTLEITRNYVGYMDKNYVFHELSDGYEIPEEDLDYNFTIYVEVFDDTTIPVDKINPVKRWVDSEQTPYINSMEFDNFLHKKLTQEEYDTIINEETSLWLNDYDNPNNYAGITLNFEVDKVYLSETETLEGATELKPGDETWGKNIIYAFKKSFIDSGLYIYKWYYTNPYALTEEGKPVYKPDQNFFGPYSITSYRPLKLKDLASYCVPPTDLFYAEKPVSQEMLDSPLSQDDDLSYEKPLYRFFIYTEN